MGQIKSQLMNSLKCIVISLLILHSSVFAQTNSAEPFLNLPRLESGEVKAGSDFLIDTKSLDYKSRQEAAVKWILKGNVPFFMRSLVPVRFENNHNEIATIWVTCDYMSIGEKGDFIRIPLSLPSAREIASALGMYLPTAVMVDSIFSQAQIKLQPIPMKPGKKMRSNEYYSRHQILIEEQLKDAQRGRLISGHKKDIVITNRLIDNKGKVAIYGWHYEVEDPIQPLSLVHSEEYEDYSHGLRLIYPVAEVNGEAVEFKELINKPEWSGIFTSEAKINIEGLSHGN